MGKAIACVNNNPEYLGIFVHKGLHFPPGYTFAGRIGESFVTDAWMILVQSPEIPDRPNNAMLPRLATVYDREVGQITIKPWDPNDPYGDNTEYLT